MIKGVNFSKRFKEFDGQFKKECSQAHFWPFVFRFSLEKNLTKKEKIIIFFNLLYVIL